MNMNAMPGSKNSPAPDAVSPFPIFCAIDTDDLPRAVSLVSSLVPMNIGIKLGMEFINSFGPAGIEKILKAQPNAALFIDLKFHDIPNTVAAAVRTLTSAFYPVYINLHAAGGQAMMEAAREACAPQSRLLAVTILTSLNAAALRKIGFDRAVETHVEQLALLAQNSGMDGVVCSPLEIERIRESCGEDYILMVPGIRLDTSAKDDQKRVMTPHDAFTAGATHLVIGRPITEAPDPAEAARTILQSLLPS